MDDIVAALESKLRTAVTEASVNGRQLKVLSKEWSVERAGLEREIVRLQNALVGKEEDCKKLAEALSLHRDLNARYIQLARFVLFCGMATSPEEVVTDLRPEDLVLEFNDFKGSVEFESFLAKAAVVLALGDATKPL